MTRGYRGHPFTAAFFFLPLASPLRRPHLCHRALDDAFGFRKGFMVEERGTGPWGVAQRPYLEREE